MQIPLFWFPVPATYVGHMWVREEGHPWVKELFKSGECPPAEAVGSAVQDV